ncbi:MAG: DUF4124 domain-containing protein [Pseudomonadota bacterium]|nr:DUF4124 domain-containing protein [Pseudomonadota bacterium]
MKTVYLTLLLSVLSVNIHAEIYKWVDEEGFTQYSQTPPPEGIEATVVESISVQTVDTPETAATPSAEETTDETSEQSKDALKASCQEAQKQLQLLQNGDELMIPDQENPGEYKPLSAEIRQQKINKTQAYIDNYCQQPEQP